MVKVLPLLSNFCTSPTYCSPQSFFSAHINPLITAFSRPSCLFLYFLFLSDSPRQSCPMQLFALTTKCLHNHLSCLSANAFTIHKFWKPRYQIDHTVRCPYSWQTGHLCPLKLLGNDNFTSAEFPFRWISVTQMLGLWEIAVFHQIYVHPVPLFSTFDHTLILYWWFSLPPRLFLKNSSVKLLPSDKLKFLNLNIYLLNIHSKI